MHRLQCKIAAMKKSVGLSLLSIVVWTFFQVVSYSIQIVLRRSYIQGTAIELTPLYNIATQLRGVNSIAALCIVGQNIASERLTTPKQGDNHTQKHSQNSALNLAQLFNFCLVS